jgi:hypothetical protein
MGDFFILAILIYTMNGNIFKLKKDKIDEWKNWSQYLLSHKDIVEKTLTEENVSFEGSFLFTHSDNTFVCLYTKTNENGVKKDANLEGDINTKHREKMKECFEEKISKIENLYLFRSTK